MHLSRVLFALAIIMSFCQPHILAGTPAPAAAIETERMAPLYLGTVTTGVKTHDAYTDGHLSIVVPVWSTLGADATLSGGIVYLEPYASYGEMGEIASSLGLGYRYLFGSQPVSALEQPAEKHQAGFLEEGVFVGANLFVDMLDTEADNQFWQLGFGLEAGSRYLELRGNYYLPLSDRQIAEEIRTQEIYESSSRQSWRTTNPLTTPYATGHTISQDVLLTTHTKTTTRTTTIDRLFQRFEDGMEGWDAEAAVLVPWLDQWVELKLVGGYYSFDNQTFGPQTGGTGSVDGWKAGIEFRPVPAVILSGTWYEDDRLTGSDWTVGLQLQFPFEAGELGDGKGFWDRIGDAFTPRRRHLAERLAEPVRRQNAAIKIGNSIEEKHDAKETNTSVRVTRVVSQTRTRLVLADDIVFVNNGGPVGNGIQAGSATGNGTAEFPVSTIQSGANVAASQGFQSGRVWTVYTQETGNTYNEQVAVSASTRFTSSYLPVYGVDGSAFGGNTARPVLSGGFTAYNVGSLSISGFEIRGTDFGNGIAVINTASLSAEVLLLDNHFSGEFANGILIQSISTGSAVQTLNATIQNNVFSGVFGNGISIAAYAENQAELSASVAVMDNAFSGQFTSAVAFNTSGTSRQLQFNAAQNQADISLNNGPLSSNMFAVVGAFFPQSQGFGSLEARAVLTGNTFSGQFASPAVVRSESLGSWIETILKAEGGVSAFFEPGPVIGLTDSMDFTFRSNPFTSGVIFFDPR